MTPCPARTAARRAGFTLVEVLIAIAIVAILGGLVAINFIGTEDRQKPKLALTELRTIQSALDQFRIDMGRYPTEEEGIAVLWDRDALEVEEDADADKWSRYLNEPKPNDLWDNPWNYRAESEYEGEPYDLWSNGPDGEEGTDDDIVSWNEGEDDLGSGSAPIAE
ncbi:MAG: GspG family T2SS major pseudopilin variant ExeG [Phycisphaerales bacterium]